MSVEQFEMLIRIDERTENMSKDVAKIEKKMDNLKCEAQSEKIYVLERDIKGIKKDKLSARVTAIEKVFWPSFLSGISGFIAFIFFLIKTNFKGG